MSMETATPKTMVATPQIPTASERRRQQAERRQLLQTQLIYFCESEIDRVVNKKSVSHCVISHNTINKEIPGLNVYLAGEIMEMLQETYKPQHYNVKYDDDNFIFTIEWDKDY